MASLHELASPTSYRSSEDTLLGSMSGKESDDVFLDQPGKMESRFLLDDIESRPAFSPTKDLSCPPSPTALEYRIPIRTKVIHLALYFLLNLSLTIYNKAILGSVSTDQPRIQNGGRLIISPQFEFPWLLTALHATSASIGCLVLLSRGVFTLTRLSARENLVLVAFSFLFTINIAMSNVSL